MAQSVTFEWNRGSENGDEEIANADCPEIRYFHVSQRSSVMPLADVYGSWNVCSPATIHWFSAVGYYFGKNLQEDLDIPIGLIGTYVGGTNIERWISVEGFPSLNQCKLLESEILIDAPKACTPSCKVFIKQKARSVDGPVVI